MVERSANYVVSKNAQAQIPEAVIKGMIRTTVDKAYEGNMCLSQSMFVNRFNMFTVHGKIATGMELLKALKDQPQAVGQILPVVGLTEEQGEDIAYIILQSEIESFPELGKQMRHLLDVPPNVTVEQLLAQARACSYEF